MWSDNLRIKANYGTVSRHGHDELCRSCGHVSQVGWSGRQSDLKRASSGFDIGVEAGDSARALLFDLL